MLISAIGDSLTKGDYGVFGKTGIANVHQQSYPYFLSLILGCRVNNFGVCGIRTGGMLKRYTDGEFNAAGSDIVIVMLGTNGGFAVGKKREDKEYARLIELIRQDAPRARIFVCTPPHCTENPFYSNCGYIDNVTGATDFVRDFAAHNSDVTLIDVNAFPEFNADTEADYQPNDGLHFNENGYRVLAAFIADNLRKHCPELKK